MGLLDELEARVLCGDGAMGTLLMAAGMPLERCFEELCVSDPDRIRTIHQQYISAGARVIETNTFGANALRLARFGMEGRVAEINRAGVRVAKEAAQGKNVYVAGSVGPLGINADEAAARGIDRSQRFREQISALLEGGVDAIFFETFMDVTEMEMALCVKKELSDLPAICSFACAVNGRLPSGMPLTHALATLREQGAKVSGLNCMNGPDDTVELLRNLPGDFLLAAYPSAGQPRHKNGGLTYNATPKDFAEATHEMIAQGVRLIGGCCGTNQSHIAAMAAAIRDLPSTRARQRE
jgi:methionine synthase / methylenetetrahydrofolate reductase(NADPH)